MIHGQKNEDADGSKDGYRNKLILEERDRLFETVGNSDHAILAAVYTEWDNLGGGGVELSENISSRFDWLQTECVI